MDELERELELLQDDVRALERAARAHRSPFFGNGALECIECGAHSDDDAAGWKTYLTVGDQFATYCADCAADEFDER